MKTLLTSAAMIALIAGATGAKAWDQQATEAQMDYEISQHQAAGSAFASTNAPAQFRSHNATVPAYDFQLGGR